MTNLIAYFHETDRKHNGDYTALLYREGGAIPFTGTCHYPILFVLQGGLLFRFRNAAHRLVAGTFAMIDYSELLLVDALPQTVVLVYTPPVKLLKYLGNCQNAFHFCISLPIFILPPLQQWINDLFARLFDDEKMDQQTLDTFRHRFSALLMEEYTPGMLNELYVPFYVYHRGSFEGD